MVKARTTVDKVSNRGITQLSPITGKSKLAKAWEFDRKVLSLAEMLIR